MENRYANVDSSASNAIEPSKTKTGLTPRELIHYHMNNPDEPISDEDIENLVLHTNSTAPDQNAPVDTTADAADNRMLNDKDIKKVEDNTLTTPYDILRS